MKQCTCYALRAIDCTCKPAEYGELYTSPTAKQEPMAIQMDVIVVNLVREGINKHRARELAEHFIKHTTPPKQEAKDEPANDELLRLRDLLGKANALARIRANEIESLKASLYGLYELEKQRDELEQRLTKTEAQLGEAVWNYGELKREQLANQQKTSGSPIFSELHCICGAEWEWRNRDWELVTTPPQRKPLTDEEIQQIFIANSLVVDNGNAYMVAGLRTVNIAQAIEAKLKEKNT